MHRYYCARPTGVILCTYDYARGIRIHVISVHTTSRWSPPGRGVVHARLFAAVAAKGLLGEKKNTKYQYPSAHATTAFLERTRRRVFAAHAAAACTSSACAYYNKRFIEIKK